MRYVYPYDLTPQPEGGFTVTFPDVPEAITQGDTEAEAAAMAEDALVTALSFYTDDAKPLPRPSAAYGRNLAYVPTLVAAKLALHDAMLSAGVSNVAFALRLGVDEKIVRRLRDPLHKSRIDQVEAALRVLDKRIEAVVREASFVDRPNILLQAGDIPEERAQLLYLRRLIAKPAKIDASNGSKPKTCELYRAKFVKAA